MKKLIILLAVAVVLLQAPAVSAQVMKAEGEVIVVNEEQLIELAGQEKFGDLMGVLKKLVQKNLPAEGAEEQAVFTGQITILDFKYLPAGKLKIYYCREEG